MKNKTIKKYLFRILFINTIVIALIVGLTINVVLKSEYMRTVEVEDNQEINNIYKKINNKKIDKQLIDEYAKKGYLIDNYIKGKVSKHKQELDVNMSYLHNKYYLEEQKMDNYKISFLYSKTYEVDNNIVEIARYRPMFINQDQLQHLSSLSNSSYLIGGLVFILMSLSSIIVSSKISRPIKKLEDDLDYIIEKVYDIDIESQTNIKEINEIINKVNYLKNQLKSQSQLRKQFLEDIAHELRTPLTNLSMILENISEGVWEYDGKSIDKINKEVNRMILLVGDFEKVERIENDLIELNKKDVNMKNLIEESIAMYQNQFESNNIILVKELEDIILNIDENKIKQVFLNLIDNAIKYGKDNMKFHIKMHVQVDNLVITFKDEGIGMSQEQQQLIFNRLYQINDELEGKGIGLALPSRIINLLGGEMLFLSEEEKGSEFIIILKK
ncbi:MAG: HAMP domain-containing sensor histidine kinase [Erysipelotrichales bacterium]